jgi:DNA polymerase/3'-5' exonuclease PolX
VAAEFQQGTQGCATCALSVGMNTMKMIFTKYRSILGVVKMNNQDALELAQDMISILKPACTRIEVAGSIRRGKEDVKDIEIVAIPDLEIKPARIPLEFGKPVPKQHKTKLDEILTFQRDHSGMRFLKWGDKYKKLAFADKDIYVDLFLVTPPASWGVQYLIRTGPADFSHWMVTQRRYGGALPNSCRVKDGTVWVEGEKQKYPLPEEEDFFKLCGLEWIEPDQRQARWIR